MVIRTTLDRFYTAPFQAAIGDFLRPAVARGGVAVDLGCGPGIGTESLRTLGFTALGIDIDPDRIAAARARFPACGFRVADVTALPLPDAACDLVFSCSVLQYVDHRRMLAECRRVLRPGGRAIFIENLAGHPLARAHRRLRRRHRRAMPAHRVPIRHLDIAGLDVFADYLDVTAVHTANLVTPLALAPAVFLRRTATEHAGAFQRLLFAADRRLLAWQPALARYCWTVLVCAVTPG
jgi:SAM-dependent methyltransferase